MISDYIDPKYLKRSTYSARGTIISQFVAGLVCLLAGFGFIYLMTEWANTWNIYWSDNNKHDFFTGYILGSIGLVVLVAFVTAVHFEQVLEKHDLFRWSIKASIGGGIFAIVFMGFLILLLDQNLVLFLAEATYDLILAVSLGSIVGLIQVARIRLEKFDPDAHRWLTSNEADRYACKLGMLPYRQQVKFFWGGFFAFVLLLSLLATLALPIDQGSENALTFLLFCGLVSVFLFLFLGSVTLILFPEITSTRGIPTKTHIPRKGQYRPEQYKLRCNGLEFSTNAQTWHGIRQGRTYQLWYSKLNNRVMAFEQIPSPVSRRHRLPIDESVYDISAIKRIEKQSRRRRNVSWIVGLGTILLTFFWHIMRGRTDE